MESFEAFFTRHRERLFGYLMRLTGDYDLSRDLLQESFTRYLSSYANRDPNPPLLYTIARNALLDIRRRQGRALHTDVEPTAPGDDPERRFLVREQYRQMLSALEKLKDTDRELLALSATGDLKYRQIAEILGISENGVKVRIHRSRVRLRKILEEMNHERASDQRLHRR